MTRIGSSREGEEILAILKRLGITDAEGIVRLKDVLVSLSPTGTKEYTVIDFETLPYRELPESEPEDTPPAP